MLCRRPPPSLLFTAIAATIVVLPWAVDGLPGDDNPKPVSQAPQFAQQSLTGLGGGETVREIHQDTPFSMVALTAEDLTGTSAKVRAKKSDGSWGPWYEAETLEGVGPDVRGSARHRAPIRRPHHHGADLGHPPAGRRTHRGGAQGTRQAGPGLCARQCRAALRTEHQRGADQPAAGAGGHLAAAVRRHDARPATQHHQPRTVGRRRGDAVREHGVRQRNPGRGRAPHRGQQ